ncbi:MAG TPA: cytochrome c oxidase subunit 3 [Candidatus Sulfotelmatobacter sp.]|nr:cytochrome c oxidase subunit 3 [Candidatus Sulfotelmatobacter sp.]
MSETHAGTHAALMEASPFGIQSKKLAMWLFIASDAVTFGAVLFGYSFLRVGSLDWSYPFKFSPSIINAFIMTVILLTSSLTMLAGVFAAKAGNKARCLAWMGVTMLLGAIFAILHLREWFHMFDEGWGLFKNPLGGSADFGAGFFGITGLHLTHVVSGVIALAVVALGYNSGRLDKNHVETTSLYWHFVDFVWMFVFPIVYLMNAAR